MNYTLKSRTTSILLSMVLGVCATIVCAQTQTPTLVSTQVPFQELTPATRAPRQSTAPTTGAATQSGAQSTAPAAAATTSPVTAATTHGAQSTAPVNAATTAPTTTTPAQSDADKKLSSPDGMLPQWSGSNTPTTGATDVAKDAPVNQQAANENPAPAVAVNTTVTVDVTDHGTVTLAAQGIEITKLLELLSIKSKLNIVASEKVKALVSVSLYDVPVDQALDALLTVNGFVWERQGPFIMVYARAEKEAMDKSKLKRDAHVFTLQFLSPDDALALVKPLLSEGGTAVSLGKVKEGYEPTITDGGSDTYAFATRVHRVSFLIYLGALFQHAHTP